MEKRTAQSRVLFSKSDEDITTEVWRRIVNNLPYLLKIKGTLVRQKTTELLRKALGPQALPYLPEQFDEGWNEMPIGPEYAGPIAKQYFNMRKISIYGGSNEIQKNIVAKASFGL